MWAGWLLLVSCCFLSNTSGLVVMRLRWSSQPVLLIFLAARSQASTQWVLLLSECAWLRCRNESLKHDRIWREKTQDRRTGCFLAIGCATCCDIHGLMGGEKRRARVIPIEFHFSCSRSPVSFLIFLLGFFLLNSSRFVSWHPVWLLRPTKDTMSNFNLVFFSLPFSIFSLYFCRLLQEWTRHLTLTGRPAPSVSSISNADNGSKSNFTIWEKRNADEKGKQKIT